MNVKLNVFSKKKQKQLKKYAIAKYLYYILIRGYYYVLKLPRLTRFLARYLIQPLVLKKETRYNRFIRAPFLLVGGGSLRVCDLRAQRYGWKIMLDYFGGHFQENRKQKKPVVYIGWSTSSEFIRAFDVTLIIPEAMTIGGSMMPRGQEGTHQMLELFASEAGSMDTCSAAMTGAGAYFAKQLPEPDLIITSAHACDSHASFYPSLQRITGVPMYVLDSPYGTDEASYKYFEKNLWSMIRFLEEQLKQKINWDKLKESCEALNTTNYYLKEITEMGRAIPSPVSDQILMWSWAFKLMGSGSPLLAKMTKTFYENAKARLDRGEGWVKDEKIRMIWYDLPVGFINIFPWLEKEFGAVAVGGDLVMRCVTPIVIDTSSEESMIRGMAKVHLNVGMVRSARGPSEYFADDFERIIEEYSGDCFIFTGHYGCKHVWALSKIKKDICKRAGLPALFMSSDFADSRLTSEESLKKQISDFFISNGLA